MLQTERALMSAMEQRQQAYDELLHNSVAIDQSIRTSSRPGAGANDAPETPP